MNKIQTAVIEAKADCVKNRAWSGVCRIVMVKSGVLEITAKLTVNNRSTSRAGQNFATVTYRLNSEKITAKNASLLEAD
jgi:hypothetical protein